MSHLYQQYVKAIAKWPLDGLKSRSRNVRHFLEADVEKAFGVDPKTGERVLSIGTTHEHERRVRALNRLLDNDYLRSYPNSAYRTGHMGLTLEQLRKINSDEGRARLGMKRVDDKGKWSWRKWIFR